MERELKILLLTSAFFTLAAGLFGPLYAVFVEQIGGDLLTAGTAYSVFAVSSGILIFFLSRWEDHVKHQEKLLVFGYAFNCLGFIGYLTLHNTTDLYIVQIIFGLGQAFILPAFDGLYSKHLDRGKFVSEWGLFESAKWIIIAIAAAAGGLISDIYGFRFMFIIMLIVSVLCFFVSLFLLSKKKKRRS